MSHFCLEFFIREKHPKPRGNQAASASVYFNSQRPALTDPWNTDNLYGGDGGDGGDGGGGDSGACVRARACVMCLQYTIIIFDPRLIMLIIKIIILCCIQIRHSDDFPSTGTRLVYISDGQILNIYYSSILCSLWHNLKRYIIQPLSP